MQDEIAALFSAVLAIYSTLGTIKTVKLGRTLLLIILLVNAVTGISQTDSVDYKLRGVGFNFGPCTGLGLTTGHSKNLIKVNCQANLGINYIAGPVDFSLRFGGSSGNLLQDLDYDTNWKEGFMFNSLNFELGIGYHILNLRKIGIIPILAAGYKNFNVREKNGSQITKTNGDIVWSPMIAFDYKMHSPKTSLEDFKKRNGEQQYWSIRLTIGAYPNYFKNPFNIEGNLYYVNLSFGGNLIAKGKKK